MYKESHKLQPILERDKRIEVIDNKERLYAIKRGAKNIQVKEIPANNQQANISPIGSYTAQFNVQPPTGNVCISRRIYNKIQLTINFQATRAPNQSVLNTYYDCLQSFPLSTNQQLQRFTINGITTEATPYVYMQALARFKNPVSNQMHNLSTTPMMQDNVYPYQVIPNVPGTYVTSPFSPFYDNENSRAAFPYDIVANPINAGGQAALMTASITVTLIEPLIVAPFTGWNESEEQGLYNVSSFYGDIIYNFGGQGANSFSGLWSHIPFNNNDDFAITSTKVQTCSLLVTYLSPDDDYKVSIPKSLTYPYYGFEYVQYNSPNYTIGQNQVNQGSALQLITNSISLAYIPNAIYTYVVLSPQSQKMNLPQINMPIITANYTFGNSNGKLSSATQSELYQISRKNGYNNTYLQWSGGYTNLTGVPMGSTLLGGQVNNDGYSVINTSGSVLAIQPAFDLELDSITDYPGKACSYVYSVTLNIVNPFSPGTFGIINTPADNFQLTVYSVFVKEGEYVMDDGIGYIRLGSDYSDKEIRIVKEVDPMLDELVDIADEQGDFGMGSMNKQYYKHHHKKHASKSNKGHQELENMIDAMGGAKLSQKQIKQLLK